MALSFVLALTSSLTMASARLEGAGPPPTAKPLPDSAFRVEWEKVELPAKFTHGQAATVRVTVKNVSDQTWPDARTADPSGSGVSAVRLSYRWWDINLMRPVGTWGGRVDLKGPVGPGESVTFTMPVTAPAAPNPYWLQFDLVQEMVAWFEGKGAAKLYRSVNVK
jgi:hypothetical protein